MSEDRSFGKKQSRPNGAAERVGDISKNQARACKDTYPAVPMTSTNEQTTVIFSATLQKRSNVTKGLSGSRLPFTRYTSLFRFLLSV